MKQRHRKTLTWAVLFAGLLFSGVSYAQPGDHKDDPKGSEKMEAKHEGFFKELNFNEDQKKALKANKEKHRQDTKAVFEDMHAKMKLMREELQKDHLDMGKVNQIQADLKATQAKMMDQRLEHILEVRKILTPEQFKQFSQKMEEHRGQRREKKHNKENKAK